MTVHNQAFFLDLARRKSGETHDHVRERWNAWRRDKANERVWVTFAGVDFTAEENLRISFAGFEFGLRATFAGATFGDHANFSRATFGDRAAFSGTTFGYSATFVGAAFGGETAFSKATFGRQADFSGATFDGRATFSGAAFSDFVTFSGVTFCAGAAFSSVKFGDNANFSGANFGRRAFFKNAAFGYCANFSWVDFGGETAFHGTTFGQLVDFSAAAFGEDAHFSDAKFGSRANLSGAIFRGNADFSGATFDHWTNFSGAKFDEGARFFGSTFGRDADFSGRTVEALIVAMGRAQSGLGDAQRARREKEYRERLGNRDDGPAKFSRLDFASAHFLGDVSFAHRSFEHPADFTGVRFDGAPDFDGATNLQRIDFTGARAEFAPAGRPWWKPDWTKDSKVAVRLRALRSQIEATKNHDFERDLYIEERKAERGIYAKQYREQRRWRALLSHYCWIAVMALYWALADYGRSWVRPAAWLVISTIFFGLIYGQIFSETRRSAGAMARAAIEASWDGKDALVVVKARRAAEVRTLADFDTTIRQIAVAHALPFIGPLTVDADAKKFLFCGVWPAGTVPEVRSSAVSIPPCRPIPPSGYQWTALFQNLLSILLVFFIGLALRNYFRLK